MPIPSFNKLPPNPTFNDLTIKINQLVGEMTNMLLNLDSLNVVSLTADHIDAGTIDANVVTLRSDLNAGAYIQIDGNGLVINNGTFDTFTADINGAVTMTRALIQSTPGGYPRVVMDPVNELFGAYTTPTSYATFGPDFFSSSTDAPVLNMTQATANMSIGHGVASLEGMGIFANSDFEIQASGGIFLSNTTYLPSWDSTVNMTTSETLQQALNERALSFVNTGTAGAGFYNGGIAPGTQLLVAGGGSVSWSGINIPDHVHIQI